MRPIQTRDFSEASRNASKAREGTEQRMAKAMNYNIQEDEEDIIQEDIIQEDEEGIIQEDFIPEAPITPEDLIPEDLITEEPSYENKISEWKILHGKIFKSTIDGQEYIWMKIKRSVYVEIMNHKDESEDAFYKRQELIARKCVLFPENIGTLIETNGGLATTLSDEIIFKSGFDIQSTIEL